MADRADIVRRAYEAYVTGDRALLESLIADDYRFWSPHDDGIDRATYLDRCWPAADHLTAFAFERLIESGDEVVVTYIATRTDGTRFRNTEVHTVPGTQMAKTEVYFGWDL
jgi:ketosteroid isomerase-like protein